MTMATDVERCDRCNWPVYDDTALGCTRDSCSQRPLPPTMAERLAARRAELRAQGDVQELVREFHEKFGQPALDKPTVPSLARCDLRERLMSEEHGEVHGAMNLEYDYDGPVEDGNVILSSCAPHLPHLAKELGDLLYVIYGTALEFGIDMVPVVKEIHRSNLTKLDDDGSPVFANGKVTKGPNYQPPDIERVLREQGWEGP